MFHFPETIFKTLILLAFAAAAGKIAFAGGDTGIVRVKLLNLRDRPAMNGNVLDVLPEGSRVQVAGEVEGWLEVRHKDMTGYVRNLDRYIDVIHLPEKDPPTIEPSPRKETLRREAEKLDERIGTSERELTNFVEEENSLLTRLDEIDIKLNEARARVAVHRSELVALEREMEKAARLGEQYREKLDSLSAYAKKRLASLYKMNRLGALSVTASAKSISELFFLKRAMERIYDHDEELRRKIVEKKRGLQELLTLLEARGVQKEEVERKLEKQIGEMVEERDRRNGFLARVRMEKSSTLELLEEYRRAAGILDEKIRALDSPERGAEKEDCFSGVDFESFKGLLNMPVECTIVDKFGPGRDQKLGVERFNNGISVKADRGEPVRAVQTGRVLFAGWFKGYGNMVIIDHGRRYHTVYAYAEEIFKSRGDSVESGEVIATVGNSGSISGPELYFEVRHHGKPVDPMEWIKTG